MNKEEILNEVLEQKLKSIKQEISVIKDIKFNLRFI
jgi:hypothetical protein